MLAAMVFATVIIVVALRSRRSTADLTEESRYIYNEVPGIIHTFTFSALRSPPVGTIQMNSLSLEDPHEYEDISEYNEAVGVVGTSPAIPEEEFSITPCSAYTPTTTRSVPMETELGYGEVRAPTGTQVQEQARVGPEVSGEEPPQGQRSTNVSEHQTSEAEYEGTV